MKIIGEDKYVLGRSNLAVTIFVPYDCPNHCPFCTSKDEYWDCKDFSLPKILESVSKLKDFPQIKDIVITGGEPFADLEQLETIINHIKDFGKHIYINTTLPVDDKADEELFFLFLKKHSDVINGLNISRHMMLVTHNECDELIERIHKALPQIKLRINSVLFDLSKEKEKVTSFITRYHHMVDSISFRGDYTKVIDQNTLRGLDHPILDILFEDRSLEYLGSGGCLVCNNNDFYQPSSNTHICLHRGYEHSLVKKGHNLILNDIIIKQDGRILSDWDGELLDIELLKYQWMRNYNR